MYHRYHIDTETTPDISTSPSRFRVKVNKFRLATLLLKELIEYRGNKQVVLSRPCVYGVFSGPVGGFAPRDEMCVGCLRCTTQYPEMVQVLPNPKRLGLGDSYFTPELVETVCYEARTGRVPVRGAGYRGPFGGEGWDGMWTDMSEIVRPTRDGIHGREFISTLVDIGWKPASISFNESGEPVGELPKVLSLPIPFLFDAPPRSLASGRLAQALANAAHELQTLVILPARLVEKFALQGSHIVPLVQTGGWDELKSLRFQPAMLELEGWDEALFKETGRRLPKTIICLRLGAASLADWSSYLRSGARVFHLVADYHGRAADGRLVDSVIREAHRTLLQCRCRDQVTLLGSGGIIAAEHIPKAIICGLDAVALDTPLLVALGASFKGECADREASRFSLPRGLTVERGVRRIKNLVASWRDQLLEVLGAMGLREVRRLRGEIGRAMFQKDLEREAFSGIEGYDG